MSKRAAMLPGYGSGAGALLAFAGPRAGASGLAQPAVNGPRWPHLAVPDNGPDSRAWAEFRLCAPFKTATPVRDAVQIGGSPRSLTGYSL
jgi:hypothetical protein